MRRSKLSALARSITLLASVGAPCLAQAADLLPSLPPEPLPPPIEIGGAWYLRGDAGAGILGEGHTVAKDVTTPPIQYNYNVLKDYLGNQAFVGAGIGYQANSWLRFDFTGEYRSETKWIFYAAEKPSGGINRTSGKFSSVVGMANGYVDLGTYYGVTPFVGAGVGFAHHMFGGVTDNGQGLYQGGFGSGPEKQKLSFAWAAPCRSRLFHYAEPQARARLSLSQHGFGANRHDHLRRTALLQDGLSPQGHCLA